METEHLTLEPATTAMLDALIAGDAVFEAAYSLRVAEGYNEFPEILPHTLRRLRAGETTPEWATYLFIHRAERMLIGLGGYVNPPDANGGVEFGYEVAPSYRGRGYATEAARAFIDHALTFPNVQMIYAHTLPERSPSTAVLRKCGMVMTGQVTDPEEGRLWRWQVQRAPVPPGAAVG